MQAYVHNKKMSTSISMSMSNSSTDSLNSLDGSFSSQSSWDDDAVFEVSPSLQNLYCAPNFPSLWIPSQENNVVAIQDWSNTTQFDSLYEPQYQQNSHTGLSTQCFTAYDIMVQSPQKEYQSIGGYISPRKTTLFDSFSDHNLNYESSSFNSMQGTPESSVSPCVSAISSPTRSTHPQQARQVAINFELPESSLGSSPSSHTVVVTTRRQVKLQKRRKTITNEQEFHEQFPETNLKRSGTRKHVCSYPSCNARFERTEHVKRHEGTVHNSPKFACVYCKAGNVKYFPAGRRDNYKDHLRRHMNVNTTRTNFNPDAKAELDEMDNKAGKRTKTSKKTSLVIRSRL